MKHNSRFILQKSQTQPNGWVCTDTIYGIVCCFENGKFNETQKFTILEEIKNPDANILSKAVREMADWLRENHYNKVIMCYREIIGKRIAEIRKSKGLTCNQLAEITGLTQGNLSRIELGMYSTGIDILGKIADALGCDIDFIEKR